MAKPACKCKETECEECPEWIFTLADLIMCMMGLFVLLWVLKPSGGGGTGDQAAIERQLQVIAGIRDGFGYEPNPTSSDPVDRIMIRQRNGELGAGNATERQDGADGTDNSVTTIRMSNTATIGGRILFEAGKADLDAASPKVLAQIATLIRGHRQVILVKGHTSMDDFGDGATPQQNLDLSLRRAQAVADRLMKLGVEQEILRVVGCSIHEPVKERAYSADLKAQNRRVEVEATSTLVEELRDGPKGSSGRKPSAPAAAPAVPPAHH